MEVWRRIHQAPHYSVSNYGRVRNDQTGRLLGYYGGEYPTASVRLSNGDWIQASIHVLVLETFVCPRPPGYVVNHKDMNKHNNHVSNLEWITQSENLIHGRRNGRDYKGGNTKVRVICLETNIMFDSIREAARCLGIHEQSITNQLNGRSRTAGGYTFQRVEQM